MKRILHIVGAMAPGGYENFIMNIYRRIDRERIQFDFIVHQKKENAYDEEIEALGGRLFYVTRKSRNPVKNFWEILRVVKNGRYDTVCRHSDSAFPIIDLFAARLGGAKDTIMHSHSTTTAHVGIHAFFRGWMGIVPARRFACSKEAGRWMFGKRRFTFIPNAIDTAEFFFDQRLRENMRKQWKMEGKRVYGHVGNFVYAKNHLFLLDVFLEISRQDKEAVLFLVGDGELRQRIEEKIRQTGLTDRVILTGRRKDVASFLQMFDLFLFPSVYEGLPVSLVEAQSTGLPCLVSGNITGEILLTDCIRRKALEDGAKGWAQEALSWLAEKAGEKRHSRDHEIKAAGYGIETLVEIYEAL